MPSIRFPNAFLMNIRWFLKNFDNTESCGIDEKNMVII